MNLYAWTNNNDTIYTSTEVPSSGGTLYNAEGEVITSVGSYSNIEIAVGGTDSIHISVNGSSSDLIAFSRDTEKDVLEPEPKYIQNIGAGGENYVIKAPSVVDNNSGMLKFWSGTKAEYDAITTKDNSTLYTITDDVEEMVEQMNPRNIGQIISSIVPLTDAGLHLLDGALLNGDGIYKEFVDYVASLVSVCPDLFCTESDWQSSVTTYGVCGKFVYGSVANTVRLPKITGILEGTTDVTALGDLVKAGLPNIVGEFISGSGAAGTARFGNSGGAISGAFYKTSTAGGRVLNETNNAWSGSGLGLDASLSSSIYGNSNTVQPQTIKVLYYIVIATIAKSEIQVDIDGIATDLNGKAEVDLTNINNQGKIAIAHNAMPSDTVLAFTPAYNTNYTMPADGYLTVVGTATANYGYVGINNVTRSYRTISWGIYVNNAGNVWQPVRKGDICYGFGFQTTCQGIGFVYAIGSESEAS